MELVERDVEAYECSSCGSLGRHERAQCCGEPREPLDATATYDPPSVEQVANAVFDISSTELAVCKAIMEEDEATIDDLTAKIPRERTSILRHLNHLVELGVVEKKSRVRRAGGRVNVYTSVPVEEVYRAFRLGLYTWLEDAEAMVDELSQEKFEGMIEQADVDVADEPEPDTAEPDRERLVDRLFRRE